MWRILVDIGINYIRKNLLGKLNLHPAFYALLDKALEMAEQVKSILTDSDKNNKGQLETLWDEQCVEILSLSLRGVGALVKKDNQAKQRVLAILANAIDDIQEDDSQTVMQVVSSNPSRIYNPLAKQTAPSAPDAKS